MESILALVIGAVILINALWVIIPGIQLMAQVPNGHVDPVQGCDIPTKKRKRAHTHTLMLCDVCMSHSHSVAFLVVVSHK